MLPHSVTTHVGSRQERLPEEVALQIHLTLINEKHFKSRERAAGGLRLQQEAEAGKVREHLYHTSALENREGE